MEFWASEIGIFGKFETFENFKISIPQIHIQNILLLQKNDKLAVSKIELDFGVIHVLIGYQVRSRMDLWLVKIEIDFYLCTHFLHSVDTIIETIHSLFPWTWNYFTGWVLFGLGIMRPSEFHFYKFNGNWPFHITIWQWGNGPYNIKDMGYFIILSNFDLF